MFNGNRGRILSRQVRSPTTKAVLNPHNKCLVYEGMHREAEEARDKANDCGCT